MVYMIEMINNFKILKCFYNIMLSDYNLFFIIFKIIFGVYVFNFFGLICFFIFQFIQLCILNYVVVDLFLMI